MHMTHHPQYQPYQQQQGYYSQHSPPANPTQHQSRKRPRLGDDKNSPQATSTKQEHEPVPPKQQWSCETCSVTVDSEKAYQAHCASHIPCPAPCCEFQGAPKIVKGHHQSVHGKFSKGGFKTVTIAVPGCKVQRFKICVGNRPEDVQQWIAERKKRFPRKQPLPEQPANSSGDTKIEKATPKETAKVGLSSLLEGYGSSSDEEEVDKSNANVEKEKEQEKDGNVITSTAAKNEIQETSTANSKNNGPGGTATSHPNYRTRICKFFARNGSCRHGENCRFKHEKVDPGAIGTNSQNRIKGATQQSRPKQPPKNLLRDLLVNDIARERNLTLQLLKYIVDQDFLSEERDKARDTETL